MPVTAQKLPNEPIVLITTHDPVLLSEASDALRILEGLLDSSQEPLWDVTDAREMGISFSDLVVLMGRITKDFRIMKHPNLGGVVLIANSELLRIGANALGQAQYGGVATRVFTSLDEAYAYARSQINKTQAA